VTDAPDNAASRGRRPGFAPYVGEASDAAPARRSRWSAMLRIAFEFALLFAIAVAAKQALISLAGGSYPNPLWLPVIVLSLQHGMAAGLAAAIIAAGVQFWDGLPPALMHEDMYGYISRIAAEPVGWCCVALLVGHIRSRQIANMAELETELAESSQRCAAVAELCVDLRSRTELLERHIAANAHASNIDVVEAITALNQATWEDFTDRLTRFVNLMTGAADFSVYLLRDNVLKIAFQPKDEHRLAPAATVAADEPVFAAIVHERRLLSAASAADAAIIGNRWILAGPLVDGDAPDRVIGMFAIAGAALEDHPDDIVRRFSLTCAEISRLVDRITVIDRWQAAAPPRQSNGHHLADPAPPDDDALPHALPQAGDGREAATDGRPLGNREITLQ
jgi:GAF domain